MNSQNVDRVGRDQTAALIITHAVRRGEERRYEEWLADILREVSRTPGYLGREIFRPAEGANKYTSIVRFASAGYLSDWVDSEARRSFVGRVSDLLEDGDRREIRTGVDFWFTPEGSPAPAAWKQFLLTTSAVYPLSLVIPRLLGLLFKAVPALDREPVAALLMALILTGLLTFVVMPPYTRLMRRWLFAQAK